jgi:hypothetical protein
MIRRPPAVDLATLLGTCTDSDFMGVKEVKQEEPCAKVITPINRNDKHMRGIIVENPKTCKFLQIPL